HGLRGAVARGGEDSRDALQVAEARVDEEALGGKRRSGAGVLAKGIAEGVPGLPEGRLRILPRLGDLPGTERVVTEASDQVFAPPGMAVERGARDPELLRHPGHRDLAEPVRVRHP